MQSANLPPTADATVAGLFYDRRSAEVAVRELQAAGFADKHIEQFFAPEGASTSEGGFFDSLAGFFGDTPRRTTVQAAPNAYARLTAMGVDEEDAQELQSRIEGGGVLVLLHAGTRAMEALEILKRNGASPAQLELQDDTAPVPDVQRQAVDTTGQEPQRIQLLKEVLRVNKERVKSGEIRLRKEVTSETQTVEVPLVHEEVVIERRTVMDGEAVAGEIGSGETIRVPVSEERVIVDKRAVVSEEVTVGKRDVQQTEQVTDTVRREELRTDTEGEVIVDSESKRVPPAR
ncbi:YsnF/AvaK domain-containing protein [Gloeobacter morelensis]|uniref:YsnF/AvaK domain-containing protein n=1 Tax=Gloeobacter morelensis MG652769 TaxID=2781736 RepID=A0ABY3PMP2_9CYAN|nr:YsnF/AvaK domain-containing protein [Gloeobacter morelensis]UFP94955.1 YsnF/AvaK domain-containing protein [Gloeobacter morelensis MG652769]